MIEEIIIIAGIDIVIFLMGFWLGTITRGKE